MKPEKIRAAVGDLPCMTAEKGRRIFEFLCAKQLRCCLELGFYHGVSTAYIAGAIEEMGGGSLRTIDLATTLCLRPNVFEVLDRVGLRSVVQVFTECKSYTWRLKRWMEEATPPSFDFCYIDGGHTWDSTGFAFYLVDALLRPGGWILFDDLDFSYEELRGSPDGYWIDQLPEEERHCTQVRSVFELLVRRHRGYDCFKEEKGWGFAHKRC